MPATGLQATGSTYDSSAYDVYSALQSELSPFLQAQAAQTTGKSGITSVPPVASTLFKPTGSGSYVINSNGTIAEVEGDGSLYGMTLQQWQPLYNAGARPAGDVGNNLKMYSLADNLQALQQQTTPASA